MKKTETTFLALVFGFALLFAGISVSHFHVLMELRAGLGRAEGALGKPRDLEMQKIRSMIERRHLSDHEALFYKKGALDAAATLPAEEKKVPSDIIAVKENIPPGATPGGPSP